MSRARDDIPSLRLRLLATVAVAAAAAAACLASANLDDPGWWSLFGRWSPGAFLFNLAFTGVCAIALRALWTGRMRESLGEGVLAAASTLGLIALLELPAWLGFDYRDVLNLSQAARFTRIKPWDNPSNVRDPELIYRHRPHGRFRGETTGDLVPLYGIATDRRYPVDVRYDARGHRNPEGLERADVVLIGDSFIEAGLVARQDLVSTRLASALGAAVANLGVSGYGPEQERVLLRRVGLALQPREVVWFFFEGNDLIDSRRYAWFRRDPEAFLDPDDRFRERSLVANLLRLLSVWTEPQRNRDAAPARRRACRLEGTPHPEGGRIYFAYPGRPLDPEDREQLERVQQVLLDAHDLTRGAGGRFRLVLVPTKFRVFHGLCEPLPESLLRHWTPNQLPARMAAFAERSGIDLFDLTRPLRRAVREGRLPYFPDDGHWNAVGHDIVSAVLARTLSPALSPTARAPASSPTRAGGPADQRAFPGAAGPPPPRSRRPAARAGAG